MDFVNEDNPIILPDGVITKTYAGCIDVYENIFSEEVSEKIIKIFEETNSNLTCPIKYSSALVGDGEEGGSYRSNITMSFNYHDNINGEKCSCEISSVLDFIKEKLSLFVRHYSYKYDVEIAFDEGLQLLKYAPGKQYKVHTDYGPGNAAHRVLSGLIYLNPGEYVGGGTHFVNFNEIIQPESPAIALFPSNYAYRHAARPVFEGYKYAIVTWFGPPWEMSRR